MDVLFLAYANNREAPLAQLQQEDRKIYNHLSPLAQQQHFLVHRDSFAEANSISQYLTQFRDQVRVFLYSGHADQGHLILEDGAANAGGVAHLLGECKGLKLVFLNGCSTKNQVQKLLELGIPAVIATSAKIDDLTAREFSDKFFFAMANQSTLQQAFDAAKGHVMQKAPNVNIAIQGNVVDLSLIDMNESLWGLYTKGDATKVLDWRLPTKMVVEEIQTFEPNSKILSSLIEGLSPFRPEFQQIQEDEEMGTEVSLGKKINLIIPALPHLLSGQLAKLLIPPSPGSEGMNFYHTPSKDRLQQLVITYNTLMQLLSFTMLAQLWELAGQDESFNVPEKNAQGIKSFLLLDTASREAFRYSDLIENVREALDVNNKEYFIQELKEVASKINESEKITAGLEYLESIKVQAFSVDLADEDAKRMSMIAEEKLSLLLHEIGFLSKYTLASIKSIDALNYRHFKVPKFRHHMVKLVKIGASDPFPEGETRDQLLDSNSVLIYKDTDVGRVFLNLSPFIIDQNAFDPKATITKLYFFYDYHEASKAYDYVHVYKPKDPHLVIQDQIHFRVLKAQFDAFTMAIFNQKMATL